MTPDPGAAVELRLRAAVESSPSGLLMTDGQGSIVLVNREVERLFGYSREELLGRSVEMVIPERFRSGHTGLRGGFMADPRVRAMGAGRDLYGLRKDGNEVPIEIGLTPVATEEGIFVLASIVDITTRKKAEDERRHLEEELRQAQKLEAVGTLAGGIAHDFNNILFAIMGYAELIARGTRTPEAVAEDLAELMKAARRGKELVERILIFSRRQPSERRPLELGPTVSEAAKLLRATLPPSIDLRVSIHSEAPPVLGDATSIHQILMNLGTNAAHAMPGGGVLEISVEPQYLRDHVVRSHPGLHEGWYAVLVVRDHGTGIDPAVRERVFEPFYTTKPKGSGTGLGLSIVNSIMRTHEGVVALASEVGRGTTATCFFPALPSPASPEQVDAAAVPPGHGEHILLVEDEPSLASMSARQLEAIGYRVTSDTDALHALETFRARPGDFDLVISDYLMSRLMGLDFARAVHNIRPDLPIVLLTGYIEELPDETIRAAGVRRLISKPATIQEVGQAVHDVLAGARTACT
jgi:PAS domain S-box-containing protein